MVGSMSALAEHQLLLALDGRCGRCAERVPGGTLWETACPRCGEPPTSNADRILYLSRFEHRMERRMWPPLVAVALATLLVGWLPLASTIVLITAMFWVRAALVVPGLRLLSFKRRVVTRWNLRLSSMAFLIWAAFVLEAFGLLPVLGTFGKVVLASCEVAFASWAATRYLTWQLGQDSQGARLQRWESVLAISLVVAFIGTAAILTVSGAWLVSHLASPSPGPHS
jgi:hypothetical protein